MIKDRVKKLQNKPQDEDVFGELCYTLCKEFHWGYETLMKQPIPFINVLIKYMNKDHKEMQKKMKKGKKR